MLGAFWGLIRAVGSGVVGLFAPTTYGNAVIDFMGNATIIPSDDEADDLAVDEAIEDQCRFERWQDDGGPSSID
jgi:hypothetical protein